MTQREQQILEWIRQDPMISQEDLAQRAGITRSSVGVHISNLMKKGCILGKGYLLPDSGYVAVAGAVNVDIGGRSAGPLVGRDSNPGTVTVSMGGVGRNIAHNLRLLGVRVSLLTALGEDPHAGQVADSCERLGIDLSRALRPWGHHIHLPLLSDETGGHGPGRVRHGHLRGPYSRPTLPAILFSTGRPWWWPTPTSPRRHWITWPTTAPPPCWWTRCPP